MDQFLSFLHLSAVVTCLGSLIYGGLSDLYRFQIPNWVSVSIAVAFVPAAIIEGWTVTALTLHLGLGIAMLALGLVLFSLRVFGGGDAKLLAATAIWIGWAALPFYLLMVALAGGVLSLFLIVFRRCGLPAPWARIAWVQSLHSEERGVPYGLAIAAVAIAMAPGLPVMSFMGS